MKYFGLGLYYSSYVLMAKKVEMHRKLTMPEIIKTGLFSLPYLKTIYLKTKSILSNE